MKHVFTAFCLAAACAVGVSAQQAQTTTTDKQNNNDQWTKPMTFSGCLRAGLTAGTFDLTHVKKVDKDATTGTAGTTGTSGTTASSASSPAATGTTEVGGDFSTLTLSPEGSMDMGSQVGHTVEVTGRMPTKDNRHITEGANGDRMSSGGAVSAGDQPSGMTTMTSGHGVGGGSGRSLRVSSLRMLASSCTDDNGGR